MRCGVTYGVPDEERKKEKRVAVPYEAADVPSKKNEYSQPDVSILLSFLAYYNEGLTEGEFEEVLRTLKKKMNSSTQISVFEDWRNSISPEKKSQLEVEDVQQIKIESVSQRRHLFEVFRKNRRCIAFWLMKCVFPKDMVQFNSSITSSSWDLSNVKKAIGFSGTKDIRRLFPTYIKFRTNENLRIKGTDGKMLDMLLQNTLDVIDIDESDAPQWSRFLESSLQLRNKQLGCVIDAGALLVGKELREIVEWVANHEQFPHQFRGISFCDENVWKVYDLNSREFIEKGTSIPDHETFVIFDECRTRGADMKMNADVVAALSLSPVLTKDSLMQAVGRLRKIGRDQKVVILLTNEVKVKIKEKFGFEDSWETVEKVRAILNWSCLNSVKENQKYFLHNAKLAAIHLENIRETKKAQVNTADTTLRGMYSRKMEYDNVARMSEGMLAKFKQG